MAYLNKVLRVRVNPILLGKLYELLRDNSERYDSIAHIVRIAIINFLRGEGYYGNARES